MERGVFIFAPDAPFPPGSDETAAISHELNKGGEDGKEAYLLAVVPDGGVEEDDGSVKNKGNEGCQADRQAQCLLHAGGQKEEKNDAEDKQQQQANYPHGEQSGQQVNHLEAVRVLLVQVDAGDTAVVDLPPELAEVGAALVPHPCFWEETAPTASLKDADAEVYVLAEAHFGEPTQPHIDVAAYAHVERTRVELVQLLLSAAYAARGKEARHGVGNGFLHVGKRGVGPVGPAESICRLALQLVFHCLQIALRQHYIRVQNDEILTFGQPGAVVTALSGAAVGLGVVMKVELARIGIAHFLTRKLRAILNNNDFKVREALRCKALQELPDFVGTVVNGDYQTVFHEQPKVEKVSA